MTLPRKYGLTLGTALLFACAMQVYAQTEASPLAVQIGTLLADPKIEGAHWGISVTQLDGTPIYALNDDQHFHPESNVKLFTTAAALALLGPQFTFHTDVVAEGDLSTNQTHLHGDLVLLGGGDANFGSNDVPYIEPANRSKPAPPETPTIAAIDELADKVAATGLRQIDGDIVGDDRYFANEPYSPGWNQDDLLWGYGAPVSALSIHDNEVDIHVTPRAKYTGYASLSATPDVPYYQLDSGVGMAGVPRDCDKYLGFRRDPASKSISVLGDMPPASAPCVEPIAIDNPAQYATLALKLALEKRGIHITGTVRTRHWNVPQPGSLHDVDNGWFKFTLTPIFHSAHPAPIACDSRSAAGPPQPTQTVLATHISPLLADDLILTNKASQNLHAEFFLRNLGVAYSCRHMLSDGLHVVEEYLLFAGIDKNDFILYDGSGLSTYDLATPRAFTQLLRFAATQPWGTDYKSSLPIGGVDGTLETRFTKAPLKGNVFAKTGTSSEDRALSGYVVCASGKTVVFSILVGDHLPGSNVDRDVMDKIVAAIAAAN